MNATVNVSVNLDRVHFATDRIESPLNTLYSAFFSQYNRVCISNWPVTGMYYRIAPYSGQVLTFI